MFIVVKFMIICELFPDTAASRITCIKPQRIFRIKAFEHNMAKVVCDSSFLLTSSSRELDFKLTNCTFIANGTLSSRQLKSV